MRADQVQPGDFFVGNPHDDDHVSPTFIVAIVQSPDHSDFVWITQVCNGTVHHGQFDKDYCFASPGEAMFRLEQR